MKVQSIQGSLLQVLQALSTFKLSDEQAADPELDVLTGVLPASAADALISSSCSCCPDRLLGTRRGRLLQLHAGLLVSTSHSCALAACRATSAALLLCLPDCAGICLWPADWLRHRALAC